jgi:hypothetical protein
MDPRFQIWVVPACVVEQVVVSGVLNQLEVLSLLDF